MRYRPYGTDDDNRFERVIYSRQGISWGTFFVGLIIGAILF